MFKFNKPKQPDTKAVKVEPLETVEILDLDTVVGGACERCGCSAPNGNCVFERQLPPIWSR